MQSYEICDVFRAGQLALNVRHIFCSEHLFSILDAGSCHNRLVLFGPRIIICLLPKADSSTARWQEYRFHFSKSV